jgi:predicted metal-dependent phosphoesterase TrpH
MSADESVVAGPELTTNQVLELRGRFRFGIGRWTYVPFEVPVGVRRITVDVSYRHFQVFKIGNVLDLGLFGAAGWGTDGVAELRGWSGGARTSFTISETDATPGYLAGTIDPGMWAVALGPVVLDPRGMAWTLRIKLDVGPAGSEQPGPESVAAPLIPRPRVEGWLRGDLHVHSVHSDGEQTPDDLVAAAAGAGLDFIASTDHNTSAANRMWADHPPDELLVLPGQEVTTRHGHWLAIGLPPEHWVDWRYTPRDEAFAAQARQVREGGGLVVVAHPFIPMPSVAWRFGFDHIDAIEVWNGWWSLDDEISLRYWQRLLRRGRHVTAVAGSDAHARHHALGSPQTVVYASQRSTVALIDGIRRGRAYLAESSAVTLNVTASWSSHIAGPGETLTAPAGAAIWLSTSIVGVARGRLSIITTAGTIASTRIAGSGLHRIECVTTSEAARFARVEVRRTTGRRMLGRMVALSNPIWFRA